VDLRILQNLPLFADLSIQEQQRIASRLQLQRYAGGSIIYNEGGESTALYVVKSGSVQFLANGTQAILATLGPGSLLGEADCFLGQPRSMGARAVTNVELWALQATDLDAMVSVSPELGLKLGIAFGSNIVQLKRYLHEKRLKRVSFLSHLSGDDLLAIADLLKPYRFAPGDTIFRAGDSPAGLYLVESGLIRLITPGSDDFSELGAGDAFGEMAVLSGRPYTSTARAVEESILWRLSVSDFTLLIAEHPSIPQSLSKVLRARLSPSDQAVAVERLSRVSIFAGLPPEVMAALAEVLLIRHVPSTAIIFTQGDPGDALYFIESGQVELVSSNPRSGEDGISRLGPGDFFGETALLTGKSRSVTARALTPVNLWTLYRSDLDQLTMRHPILSVALMQALRNQLSEAEWRFVERHLRKITLLKTLSDVELSEVSERLRPEKYRAGEIVIAEGTPGDTMYFIERGWAIVTSRVSGAEIKLNELAEGDFFGEMALLSNGLQVVSVRALTDLELWALAKSDFDDLLGRYPSLAVGLSQALGERLNHTVSLIQQANGVMPTVSPGWPSSPTYAAPAHPAAPPGSVPYRPTSTAITLPPTRQVQRRLDTRVQVAGRSLARSTTWFATRTLGARFRIIAMILFVVWLCGVSAPASIIWAVAPNLGGNSKGYGKAGQVGKGQPALVSALAFLQTPTPTVTDTPTSTRTPTVTPTPTNTATPTDTPVPPTPTLTPPSTDTPVPPTPTSTRIRPTRLPTDTPTPEPPTATPTPDVDFRVVKVRRLTACENQGNHHIFIQVLDQNGNGIPGVTLKVTWGPGDRDWAPAETGHKLEKGPGYVEFAMFHGTYTVEVVGFKSEKAQVTVDIPQAETCEETDNPVGNSLYHWSYEVVFQKVR
jgi:CRP-like cAMP-binding protein